MRFVCLAVLLGSMLPAVLAGQARPRGRELGIPFPGADVLRVYGPPADRVMAALKKYGGVN